MPIKDMTGQRFSRLSVVSRAESDANGNARWNCVCDCGATITTHGFNLRNGASKSCGCLTTGQLIQRNTTHMLCKTPEYRVWAGMLQRCTNPKTIKFSLYGGKGIKVCERWNDFESFYADMGPRPGRGYSIERADGNKDYAPGNCRWATPKEQNNNTTQNRIVSYHGVPMTLQQAMEKTGMMVTRGGLKGRLARGWTLERALETPAGKGKPSVVGKRFWRWTVIDDNIPDRSKWACRCDCGTLRDVARSNIRSGMSQSCGCLIVDTTRESFTTHGKSHTPEFQAWAAMRARCSNENLSDYRIYGGRGIKVCERWDSSFQNFIDDVGMRPRVGYVLKRLNTDGDYEPANCFWGLRGLTRVSSSLPGG